jgi:hypothetical protein
MRGRLSSRPNGGCLTRGGYVVITKGGISKMEHVRVAEAALGKPLPLFAKVHHVDKNKSNNAATNLVICPNEAYHQLLHQRMRALDACGNPDWRICSFCQQHDDPAVLYIRPNNKQAWHPACRNAHDRAKRKS